MSKVIYAGSFDPPTLGHEYIIREAAVRYEKLQVVVASNPLKKGLFSKEKIVSLLSGFISREGLRNVEISELSDEYVAAYAKVNGYTALVRGIRNPGDLDLENAIKDVNLLIAPDVETVYIETKKELAFISSSLVKALIGPKGWTVPVHEMVGPEVYSALLMSRTHETEAWLATPWKKRNWSESAYNDLMKRHTEPHRLYHTTEHLVSLMQYGKKLDLMAAASARIKDNEALNGEILLGAVMFHDAIYNPKSKTNEEDSAKLWLSFAEKEGHKFPKTQRAFITDTVRDIILATASHKKTNNVIIDSFLDIDLFILGETPAAFYAYEQQIRGEYAFVPDDIYKMERAKIMKRLKVEYFTKNAQKVWGKSREENLKNY